MRRWAGPKEEQGRIGAWLMREMGGAMAELEEDCREAEPKEDFLGGVVKREKGRSRRVLWGRD